MYKILIVEDDEVLCRELEVFLRKNGYQAESLKSFGHVAEDIIDSGSHLVLLDLNLPVSDGTFVCREVRKTSEIPIIMITSRNTELDELMKMCIRDSYMPIILAYVGWSIPGTTIILKNFFDTVPRELLEAARIDGSGEVRNMFKIVLPLMKGALSTCIVMNFTFIWGELMWARTATLTTAKGLPLTVGLMNFKGEFGTNWPLLCAAICMIIIPLYLVFLFLQKYLVTSMTAGSVKG